MAVLALAGAVVAAFLVTGGAGERGGALLRRVRQRVRAGGGRRPARRRRARRPDAQGEVVFKGERPVARVELEITEPGFDSFRTDATCAVRQQSMIGEYFVDCQQGSARRELGDGATLPVKQTTSTVPLDVVNNILRLPVRERLRLIISELGSGLAGRPEDIQEVLRRAHPGLRETTRVLRVLGDQNRELESFLRDSDVVIAVLAERKRDVARWVTETGRTGEITAGRREHLAAQLQRLPTFLGELQPTMARLEELTDEQMPLLRDLQAAAPDTKALFDELGPFAQDGATVGPLAGPDVGRRHARAAQQPGGGRDPGRAADDARDLASRCASSWRRSTRASGPSARIRAPPRPRRRRPTRRPTPAARGSPASRRSSTTSTGRGWRSTASTGSATSCGRSGTRARARRTAPIPARSSRSSARRHGPVPARPAEAGGGGRWEDPTDRDNDGIPDRFAGQFTSTAEGGEHAERRERRGRGRRSSGRRWGGDRRGAPEAAAASAGPRGRVAAGCPEPDRFAAWRRPAEPSASAERSAARRDERPPRLPARTATRRPTN